MLNPTLGRNLGRWAQAYFTSPPEKREQAVLELLRELEAEAELLETEPHASPASNSGVSETQAVPESVVCAECGHQNGKPQRFCGMCGSPLAFDVRRSEDRIPPDLALETVPPKRAEIEFPVARESVFPTLSLFAQLDSERTSPMSADPGASEAQWLRDRNLETENASSPALKYVLAGLVVFVAGAFFYNQSGTQGKRGADQQGVSGVWTGNGNPTLSNRPQSKSSPLPSQTKADPVDSGPAIPAALDPVSSKGQTPADQSTRKAADTQASTPVSVATGKNAAANSPAIPNEPVSFNPASGSLELATAEEFLRGKRSPRDSAMAAKFLWMAVSKENTTAILLLSDLYLAGDGVPKSCDQARLLLYAAARKNIPEAAQKLRNLQVGCP